MFLNEITAAELYWNFWMLYRFDFYLIIWAATWQNRQCGCAPSEDSDQPGHPPSLIRVFAVRMKKAWVLSYPLSAQRRLWSDWADTQPDWSDWVDAQPDLSLRWAHTHFVGFVMSQLIYSVSLSIYLSLPIYLPTYLPTTIYLPIYLSIHPVIFHHFLRFLPWFSAQLGII